MNSAAFLHDSPAATQAVLPAAALAHVAESLRRLADLIDALGANVARVPADVAGDATGAVFVSVAEAAKLLKCSRSHVERLVRGRACRRRVGRRVLLERESLLELARRGWGGR